MADLLTHAERVRRTVEGGGMSADDLDLIEQVEAYPRDAELPYALLCRVIDRARDAKREGDAKVEQAMRELLELDAGVGI